MGNCINRTRRTCLTKEKELTKEIQLYWAIYQNDIFNINRIISSGFDVAEGYKALQRAAEIGYVDICKLLVKHGCIPRDRRSCMALDIAIMADNEELISFFLHSGFPMTGVNRYSETLTHVAVKCDNPGIIDYLGMRGVDLEEATYGEPPIHWALRMRCTEALKALIRNGVSVDTPECNGLIPFVIAVRMVSGTCEKETVADLERVEILLNSGCGTHCTSRTDRISIKNRVCDCPQLQTLVDRMTLQPASLEHICRIKLRTFLGKNMSGKVEELRLPNSIRDKILLKDVVGDRIETFNSADKEKCQSWLLGYFEPMKHFRRYHQRLSFQ